MHENNIFSVQPVFTNASNVQTNASRYLYTIYHVAELRALTIV